MSSLKQTATPKIPEILAARTRFHHQITRGKYKKMTRIIHSQRNLSDYNHRRGPRRLPFSAILLSTTLIALFVQSIGGYAFAQSELKDGKINKVLVGKDQWVYYYVDVKDWHTRFAAGIKPSSGNADIYVRKGALPTLTDWDFRPFKNGRKKEIVTVTSNTLPAVETDRWYVGVYGRKSSTLWVGAKRYQDAAQRPGMGSIPYDGGTTFRVWAPNADTVNIAGQFNNWSSSLAQLVSENNGFWSLDYRNAVPTHEYKYVIRNGNQTLWKIDPQSEQVTNSVGNSVIFDPDAFTWNDNSFNMKPWNELVIYEMHVGTFNDAPGGLPGNFDSAILKLDHLQQLSVTALELMPINEFPGDFSWGYNLSDPFAVESIYGGPSALKRFVDEAHQRNIAVFLDVVYNHWGPNDLELWQFDGWNVGGWGGIYFYNDNRAQTPWGDTRPDFGRGEVRQYIRDNVFQWTQDYHLDGFRFDSTLNIRTTNNGDNSDGWSLMQWINDDIDNSQPWKYVIAEDMQNNAWLTKTTSSGGAGFDGQWDAQFVHPIRGSLIAANDSDRNMFSVRDAISHRYNSDAFERVIYTESHDEVANGKQRLPEEIWPGNPDSWFSKKRSTLGAAIDFTTPGVPMLFMGQEFLEDGFFSDTDPLDWSKLNTFAGINLLYQDLIKLRRNWFNNTRGLKGQNLNIYHVDNTNKLIAFHRFDQGGAGDDVIVILNFANQIRTNYNIGFPRAGTWKVRFNSDWSGYDPSYNNFNTPDPVAVSGQKDGLPFNANIEIAPYTAVILSQD